MTDRRRHNRVPLGRSSTPEKILAGGLAAAVCVGIVGVIGVRSMDANASVDSPAAPAEVAAPVESSIPASPEVVVSTDGLTREQLDAYAADLAAEKHRLDVYRVELARAARQLPSGEATSTGSTDSEE